MTDTPAHTPGPWVYRQLNAYRGSGVDPYEANARLIAAAPALLEALREAIDAIEDDRGLDDYICCSGYMCGCQGSSKRQLMLHDLRAALSQAGGASD